MLTQEDIIAGCIKDKPQAQKALYAKYAYTLMGICLRYTNSRPEAEDILQEAFIKIFSRIKSYKGEGSFDGWLKRITVTTAIDHYHQQKKKFNHVGYDEIGETEADNQNVLNKITTDELLKTLQELPDGYRMVLNLYAIEGYSHQEISEMLHISEGTSRSQLAKARRLLETILIKKKLVDA
ncbi:MAG: RNA polymerase sigma factor [Hymenobacteraceae bacterium]|nr:RNA polymerase sigma factor [Hymenobacteraceae bacterium]MDX5397080.1 RNA polymerase sigma factor [Hymenobacteraceae bacterium]MDX5442237.1 RNA polymerase sigma factor [Hymenobacteraceae bacterium]MDX5513157.1 RNA polymerase sigma factor [Hymenobacteraceae bacterium]